MTERAFQALLAELFRVTGATDAQARPGLGRCRCEGFDVALYHDEGDDPSNVHAYIDFGPVAPARQREVFRALLLRNPSFRPAYSAVVGLDADTNRIVLVARIALDATLNGRRLAAIVTQMIREAGAWLVPKPPVRFGAGKARALRRPS